MSKILTLNEIPGGRDFVCGDIHGAYSCVMAALKGLNFDKTKDRLICAGDLVDRGPQNYECIQLLAEKWFFCCLGNHEDMAYQHFTGGYMGQWWGGNGGHWINHAPQEAEGIIRHEFAKLPYLITVKNADGTRFHALHAELPLQKIVRMNIQLSDELLENEGKFLELAETYGAGDGVSVLWARSLFYSAYRAEQNDTLLRKLAKQAEMYKYEQAFGTVSPIFSGHTIVQRPLTIGAQTNIDTCAYDSYTGDGPYAPYFPKGWEGLTVVEPRAGKYWLVNDREFRETTPAVVVIKELDQNVETVKERP